MEITEILSDMWWVLDKGKRKLAVMVKTNEEENIILLMDEHTAQHLSDVIWHGKP